jgi:hypothetical protein
LIMTGEPMGSDRVRDAFVRKFIGLPKTM